MRPFLLAAVAAFLASASASLVYPVSFPIHRRQVPGTPEYDCHADCGAVIVAGRTEGYCDTANFTTTLNACLDCALEFDIWQYYGDSVSEAATVCGFDATPVPANATSTTNSSSVPEPSSASSTSSPSQSAEASISAPVTASLAETATSTAQQSSTIPTETGSTAPATETSESLGSRAVIHGGLAALPLVALLPSLFQDGMQGRLRYIL